MIVRLSGIDLSRVHHATGGYFRNCAAINGLEKEP